jgi:hypothetical protein
MTTTTVPVLKGTPFNIRTFSLHPLLNHVMKNVRQEKKEEKKLRQERRSKGWFWSLENRMTINVSAYMGFSMRS